MVTTLKKLNTFLTKNPSFRLFIFFLMLLLLSSFVSSAPPGDTIIQLGTGGLEITYPKFRIIEPDGEFHFHVYNSTGFLVTNESASCLLHAYNSSGHHVVEIDDVSFDDNGVDFYVNYSVDPGEYTFIISCNDSLSNTGGFVSESMSVKEDADEFYNNRLFDKEGYIITTIISAILLFLILGGVFFFGDKNSEKFLMKKIIGSIFFLFSYFFVVLLSFLAMRFVEGFSYYGVVRSFFILLATLSAVIAGPALIILTIMLIHEMFLGSVKK